MASIFSLNLDTPSTASYNSVPLFDTQRKTIESAILLGVGQILVRHALHPLLRAILLHRHENLETDMAMVHSYVNPSTETCRMLHAANFVPKQDFGPFSVRLNCARQFEVFELLQAIDSFEAPLGFWANMPKEFWEEMGSYLRSHNLHDTIGLSRATGPICCWVEYTHPSGHGTIARRNEFEGGPESEGTVTEWAFVVHDGAVRHCATRTCRTPPEGGGHVRS